jgi:hypothetical protein
VDQSLSWDADIRSASQEIPRLWIEGEDSLLYSQDPATGPHPEPDYRPSNIWWRV